MPEPHAFRSPPPGERPSSPGHDYGVPRPGGELIAWSEVIGRLRAARNYWLATVRPDGAPHAMPIWGCLVDDDLFLETSPRTRKARNLEREPRVVVHLEDGDHAVVVEGTAGVHRPGLELGRKLAAAFAEKYPDYWPGPEDCEDGGLYIVVPAVVFAWHNMPTATRWRF
jgi:PPOX class probable F420-dependent enzyme